jgi:hypothetical protein
MTKKNPEGGCWPTAQQELLLRASLLQGKEAINAWKEWQSNVDVDQLDWGSHRMLPLLYRNLRTQGIDHPLMGKFKGIYRYTWCQNQMLFHNMTGLLRAFHQAGINKTLLLKGAALIPLYYKDYGKRPMNDFDVLIPMEQASKAIRLLQEWHWTPVGISPEKLTEKNVSVTINRSHGVGFQDSAKRELDLHWHVLRGDDADNDFWADAIPSTFDEVPVYALNPTDQLLHVCVHGASWNPVPPLRWIADAMMMFKTSAKIEWDRLLIHAEQRRLVLPLRDTLNYLRHQMDAPIPPSILQHLQELPVSMAESLEYQAITTSPLLFKNRVLKLWFQYQHGLPRTSHIGWLPKILGFIRYLKRHWNLNHFWQIPFYAVWKIRYGKKPYNHKI